jgi:hypothetical protein
VAEQPLHVYVGTEEEQLLAFQVLAYSIHRHAQAPVEVIPLSGALAAAGIVIPEPRSPRNRHHTPFSFQRFAIPQLMGYRNRAVYIDSDQMVFTDIHELLRLTPEHIDVAAAAEPPNSGRTSQISVMVLNCARLTWDVRKIIEDLDQGRYTYRQLYNEVPITDRFSRVLPSRWNDLERYTPGVTSLTHFTDMETQPWLYSGNRHGAVWCRLLFDALEAGAVSKAFVLDQIQRGWIRPSLAYQIERQLVDPLKLPERLRHLDACGFTPPHRVGVLPKKWLRWMACKATAYGNVAPGMGARLMRSFQAVGYQAYRHLRGKALLAH